MEKGFTFAMPWKMKGLQLNEARMPPHIQDGTPMQITNFRKVEEYTKPPDYLQESELIALMDKHGIGKRTQPSVAFHCCVKLTLFYKKYAHSNFEIMHH